MFKEIETENQNRHYFADYSLLKSLSDFQGEGKWREMCQHK
jgi:hypothetical protein